ncbi:MAG: hypothetical protein Q6370_005095 [Candidatus Sigynarchaeota archaeon]
MGLESIPHVPCRDDPHRDHYRRSCKRVKITSPRSDPIMAGKFKGGTGDSENRPWLLKQFSKKINVWKEDIDNFFSKMTFGKNRPVKYFRRLICCKLKELHNLDAVINALIAMGFTDITNEEYLTRRGSRRMLQYILDDKIHRLHVRLHVLEKKAYLLVHKEPLPSAHVNNLLFHIRGFLERVGRTFNAYINNLTSDAAKFSINYDEQVELSDYEQGCHLFRDLVKEKDLKLYQSLDFYLDDHDFLAFSLKFGNVGKILPIEMLLMEFNNNIEASNLQGLSKNIQAILDVIGIPSMNKIPIKIKFSFIKAFPSLASDMESVIESFLYDNQKDKQSLVFIFSKKALHAKFIADFVEFIHSQNQSYVLIITHESSWAIGDQQDVVKLRKRGIYASHVDLHGFKALFEKFLNTPFSIDDLILILRDNEIITNEAITNLSKQKMDNQKASKIIFDVLDYLGRNPGWHPTRQLKQDLLKSVEFSDVTESKLEHVFDFLQNPLLELVKTRKEGKEISGIENKDEFKLKLKNMKKMLDGIDMFF